MMYYCNQCAIVRGFPITNKTDQSHQCEFCDRNIVKCNIGNYSVLVGLERNPDPFNTEKGSIQVHQMISLASNLPITKIHEKDPKRSVSKDFIITFPTTQKEDGSTSIFVTNRNSGEQICIQM